MTPNPHPKLHVEVGTTLNLQIHGLDFKLKTPLVGHLRPKFFLTTIPSSPEIERALLVRHLYVGNPVIIRFLQSGSIMGFKTQILNVSYSPYPLLFLDYPTKTETFSLRKHRRIDCLFPVAVAMGKRTCTGMLTNLSAGGCCLKFQRQDYPSLTTEIDEIITIECQSLFGSWKKPVRCKVMRVKDVNGALEVGVAFYKADPYISQCIENYLKHAACFLEENELS
ncbi:flagellar brake domain-containing protein [Desulfovibrio inopinatus]|uniref:flagellar brake domain-containing protein n=1 Tax=Desulfovibrio inopinatus TaxID=102109 RepID=UPI000400D71D|nr:flagellar brake protein [Desulfovibrio inopinatus]